MWAMRLSVCSDMKPYAKPAVCVKRWRIVIGRTAGTLLRSSASRARGRAWARRSDRRGRASSMRPAVVGVVVAALGAAPVAGALAVGSGPVRRPVLRRAAADPPADECDESAAWAAAGADLRAQSWRPSPDDLILEAEDAQTSPGAQAKLSAMAKPLLKRVARLASVDKG